MDITEAGTASHLEWTWLGLAGMHVVPYDNNIMIAKGKGKGKRGVGVWDH